VSGEAKPAAMTRGSRGLVQAAGYWAWRGLSAAAQRLPEPLLYALARAGGIATFYLWSSKREIARRNFARVLERGPDSPEVTRAVRRSFQNFAMYLVEIMRFPGYTAAEIHRRVVIPDEGWRDLRAVRERGKGLIFVSAHFGNFELGGARIAAEIPLNVVADEIANARIMDLLIMNRSHRNVRLFTPAGAARKVLAALRRNEMVGLMMDLGPRALEFNNTTVEFFGRRSAFPTVAAELARATGAAIVVAVMGREPDHSFRGSLLPPIYVPRTEDAAADVHAATAAIARGLEGFIRMRPEQWYIFRPMWDQA